VALETKNAACGTLHDEAEATGIPEYQSLPAFALLPASWSPPLPPIRSPKSGTSGTPETFDLACPGKPPAARNTAVFLGLEGLMPFALPAHCPKGGTDFGDNL
jgi:hypothetical protein